MADMQPWAEVRVRKSTGPVGSAAAAALWIGMSLSSVQADATGEPFDDSRISAIEYPTWFKDSFLDLGEDLAEARANGKKGIMIMFGTQGCSCCKVLIDRVLSDPEIRLGIQRI